MAQAVRICGPLDKLRVFVTDPGDACAPQCSLQPEMKAACMTADSRAHLKRSNDVLLRHQLAGRRSPQRAHLGIELQAFPERGRQRLGHEPHLVARRHLRGSPASR